MRPHLIGIAGGTASGKTTLTQQLLAFAGSAAASIVELDGYYRCQSDRPFEERIKVNYDHPDAFEFDLLSRHLIQLRAGEHVNVPVYDFAAHTRRTDRAHSTASRPIVFVEGILTLSVPAISALFDTRVFVYAPDEIRLARRINRDVKERGRTEASVLAQWNATVQPMHEAFCAPCLDKADIVVDGLDFSAEKINAVWAAIVERINSTPSS
jgi:uridine kinase